MSSSEPQNDVLQHVKTAMIDYYTLLCTMPHMKSNALRTPPPEGWPNLDVESLETLGKPDAAIDFVRHIPCLSPCLNAKSSWITPFTTTIAFNTGQTWQSWQNNSLQLPPHVVYLGLPYMNGYRSLLLDTQLGNITELAQDGISQMLPWPEYDALPEDEKWKAHWTLSAEDFFSRESQRLKRLVYMPVPSPSGEPKFHFRANTPQQEAELLAVENEHDADQKVDPDFVDEEHENRADLEDLQLDSSDEDEDADEDMDVPDDELESLRTDAGHEIEVPGQITASLGRWKPTDLPEDTQKVYEIYKRNNWPHPNFNVQQCRAELLELQGQAQKTELEKSKSASEKMKNDHLSRLTPEQLRQIEEKKRLAEERKRQQS